MFESLLDIAAVVSILIKFGHDDIIEDRSLFVAFLNELGITINNRKATSASLYNATQEITQKQREAIINEALDSYLNDVSLLHAEVKAGRDSLTNGKAVPNEEVESYFSAKRADLKRMVVRK